MSSSNDSNSRSYYSKTHHYHKRDRHYRDFSKSKNIIVYGIGTNVIDNENKKEFINAVKVTHGKYYDYSDSSISSIIEDIYSFSKTSLNKHDETRKIDIPKIPFIILCISLIGIFILRKKVS